MSQLSPLSPAQIASHITAFEHQQLKISCYIAAHRNDDEQTELEAMLPDFFREMASVLKMPEISGSLIFHERVGKLLKGNVKLVSEASGMTQLIVAEHLLNHFPLQLEMIQSIRRPSPGVAMRMAASFVETVPLSLCAAGDMGTYLKMLSGSIGMQPFVLIAKHVLDHLVDLQELCKDSKPAGLLTDASGLADNILTHYAAMFRDEMTMASPFMQLVAEYEDLFVTLRPIEKRVVSLHDMDFIGDLYKNGMDKIATRLCVDWIKSHHGIDLIALLEDNGFSRRHCDLDELYQTLKDAQHRLDHMALNLIDYSLTRPSYTSGFKGDGIGPPDLENVVVKLLLNLPEDEDVLVRAGEFLDEVCARIPSAKSLMGKQLSKSPYWRYSTALSEQRLEEDLGL
jgi:hypothetical protein